MGLGRLCAPGHAEREITEGPGWRAAGHQRNFSEMLEWNCRVLRSTRRETTDPSVRLPAENQRAKPFA
jgi:hypothetical protein